MSFLQVQLLLLCSRGGRSTSSNGPSLVFCRHNKRFLASQSTNAATAASAAADNNNDEEEEDNRSAAQAYLESWVGIPTKQNNFIKNNNSTNNPVLRARAAMAKGPLLLSSHSYLLPTLRLERNETPESLSMRLEQVSSSTAHNYEKISNGETSWYCSIILDISALEPDGSPHYQPLPMGNLTSMISILQHHGMQITGVTSSTNSASSCSSNMVMEMSNIGIPYLWSSSSSVSSSTNKNTKFDVSQILQLVQHQQKQEERNRHIQGIGESKVAMNTIAAKEQKKEKNAATNKEQLGKTNNASSSIIIEEEEIPSSSSTATAPTTTTASPISPIEFSSSSTVYHGSVRSGQQIMSSKGQSLVILGSVNSGGEVLSDGDIFVFGTLRGRAFAGLGGNTTSTSGNNTDDDVDDDDDAINSNSARIVATRFDAELIAIGDVFTTIERADDDLLLIQQDDDDAVDTPSLQTGQSVMITLEQQKQNSSRSSYDGDELSRMTMRRQHLKFISVKL